jgi:hypothetical protein
MTRGFWKAKKRMADLGFNYNSPAKNGIRMELIPNNGKSRVVPGFSIDIRAIFEEKADLEALCRILSKT